MATDEKSRARSQRSRVGLPPGGFPHGRGNCAQSRFGIIGCMCARNAENLGRAEQLVANVRACCAAYGCAR